MTDIEGKENDLETEVEIEIESQATADNDEDEDEEEIISIGDPPAIEDEIEEIPIKQWRKDFKELARQKKELEERVKILETPIQHHDIQPVQLTKPTLEGCDYDVDLYESLLLNWNEIERKKQAQQIEQQRQQEQQQADWASRLNGYNQAKLTLKVPDFDDSEEQVIQNLNVNQQGLILKYAKEAHKIIYALGKSPEKLKELAAITDPIAFALSLADIEREVRVTKRSNIKPESRIESNIGSIINNDARLEKLREQAAKTGDYSEVVKYKRSLKK